mgnify:CR=1 FL=1
MPTHRRILALACLLALQPAFAQAPDATPASPAPAGYVPGGSIPKLQGDIAIDGQLDDAAWQGALVQEIAYDIQPGDNTPAPVKTEVRIGYTDDALYVAYHALDPDPASIRAHLRDRDAAFNDDWVGLFLDTFWGGPTGLWGLSLLVAYASVLAVRNMLTGQSRPMLWVWYAGACALSMSAGFLFTMMDSLAMPSLVAVFWQFLATALLFPFAHRLIDRFEDADVRFR